MNFQTPTLQTDIARTMAATVTDLAEAVRRFFARARTYDPLITFALLWMRRSVYRLDSLVLRWKTGRLRAPRLRAPHPRAPLRPATPPESNPANPRLRAPGRNAWLVRLAQPAAALAYNLQAMFADPEIQALIAAAPQAGRIFRPLCRMAGLIPPAFLQLPKRPRPARPRPEAKPRPKPAPQAYPFPGVPRRWQTRIPGINAPRLKNDTK